MRRSIKIFVALTTVSALACAFTASWGFLPAQQSRFRDALVAFAILTFLAEASHTKLRVGHASTDSSIAFIPFLASIQLFERGWCLVLAALITAVVDRYVRNKAAIKVAFNASQQALAISVASVVFTSLGGTPALSAAAQGSPTGGLIFSAEPAAIIAAGVSYFFVNISAVSLAVSLSESLPLSEAWLRIGGSSLLYDLVSSPLGVLLAFLYVNLGILGVLLLLLPLYLVRHTYRMLMQLEDANRELLELMVKAIEARDPYTSGHSQRVAEVAALLSREYGLGPRLTEQIRTAALLHDVGKIYEEYAPLLRKEGKLDATERALMSTHSTRSAELVFTISAFRGTISDAVRHHHENFDGTGYPMRLAGEAIPIGARIIMLADTLDAMTTDRPYRKALSFERVRQELAKLSGRQFDPQLVSLILRSETIRKAIEGKLGEPTEIMNPPSMDSRFRWSRATGASAAGVLSRAPLPPG